MRQSRAPCNLVDSNAGRGGERPRGGSGSGGEASGGAGQSRSSQSGTDRGSVGRVRAGAGVDGRGSMAGASQAGIEQSPVRPAGAGVLPGTPSHTRGAATPPRWVAVTPVLPLREQCSGQRPVRW